VSFEYDLHPLTHVLAGTLTYPNESLASVLRFVRDYEADTPLDELTIYVGIGPIGAQPMACVYVCHCGDVRAGERVLKRLRDFGPPVEDTIRVMPYLDVQNLIFDRFFAHRVSTTELEAMGMSFYAKAGFVREFSDGLIESMAANAATAPA